MKKKTIENLETFWKFETNHRPKKQKHGKLAKSNA
eukprot:COSAG02_NODE_81830_length_103_cov_7490.000000_1_plen_34_part_11